MYITCYNIRIHFVEQLVFKLTVTAHDLMCILKSKHFKDFLITCMYKHVSDMFLLAEKKHHQHIKVLKC